MSLVWAAIGGAASLQASERQLSRRLWAVEESSEGAVSAATRAIAQTPDGYLWLGTNSGLARFDGLRFEFLTPSNTPALPSLRVASLWVDQQGTLWVGGSGWITQRVNGRWETVESPDEKALNIPVFREAPNGDLWVGSDGTLALYSPSSRTPKVSVQLTKDEAIIDILQTRDGVLRVATTEGVFLWTGEEMQLEAFLRDRDIERQLGSRVVTRMLETRDGRILVGGRGFLTVLSATTRSSPLQADFLSERVDLFEDSRGQIWGRSRRGLERIHISDNAQVTLKNAAILPGEGRIFEDQEGSLWVGGSTQGVARFRETRVAVHPAGDGSKPLSVNAVLEAGDGSIWLSQACEGVVRYAPAGLKVAERVQPAAQPGARPCTWSLAEDTEGRVWIGTWGHGLFRVKGDQQEWLPAQPYARRDSVVVAIHFDRRGATWLGMLKQLVRVAPDGTYRIFTAEDGLPHSDVRVIYETPAGDLWFGTKEGLAHLSMESMDRGIRNGLFEFEVYSQEQGVPPGSVRALHLDQRQDLWIGTYGGGLARLSDDQIYRYTLADGLLDDTVSFIAEDAQERLWLSGNRGISVISKSSLTSFSQGGIMRLAPLLLTESDGLIDRETNGGSQPAGLVRKNGELWFPTQAGAAIVKPDQFSTNRVAPSVVINRVLADGSPQPIEASLRLNRGTRTLQIDYSGISFLNPERVAFRHRMRPAEALDALWTEAGTARSIQYDVPRPGTYVFELLAANSDGFWTPDPTQLLVVVPTPWWQTRAAQIAVLLLLTAALLLFAQLRASQQRRRQIATETLLADRTAELREKN